VNPDGSYNIKYVLFSPHFSVLCSQPRCSLMIETLACRYDDGEKANGVDEASIRAVDLSPLAVGLLRAVSSSALACPCIRLSQRCAASPQE